jgi:hypothetical protein
MTIIPPMPVKDVEREVLQHALKLLPFAYTQNELPTELVGEKNSD